MLRLRVHRSAQESRRRGDSLPRRSDQHTKYRDAKEGFKKIDQVQANWPEKMEPSGTVNNNRLNISF